MVQVVSELWPLLDAHNKSLLVQWMRSNLS
jgi:hypothetical protein